MRLLPLMNSIETRLAGIVLALILGGAAPLANGAAYYVGNGADCYVTLGAALTAAESDPDAEIRLTSDMIHTTGRLFISRSLEIRGGYADCTAAAPTPGVDSWLSNPDHRAFYIDGERDSRHQVVIENVRFLGTRYWDGTGEAPSVSAGGVVVRGPVDVTLRNGGMHTVHALPSGGAIRMMTTALGKPEVLVENATIEQASSSSDGGAISCEGGTLRVFDSVVTEAYSPGYGGAIHASNCTVHIDGSELRDSSGRIGGAIRVSGEVGSPARLLADDSLISGNHAVNSAGAVSLHFAEGYLNNVKMIDNSSAFAASIHAYTSFMRMEGQACTRSQLSQATISGCSGIGGHEIDIDNAVVALREESILHLTRTTLADNHGAARTQVIDSRDSALIIQNSVLTANTAMERLIRFRASGQVLTLEHVSIHGNSLQPGRHHLVVEDTSSPNVRVANSIFEGYSRGFPLLKGVIHPDIHCMVTDEPLVSTGGRRDIEDPGISVDGIHLLEDSPAIDFCELILSRDIDEDDRPVDVPGIANPSPSRFTDAGADEFIPGPVSDTIFTDRFGQQAGP